MPLNSVIQAALCAAADSPAYHALPIAQARALARQGYPNRKIPVPVGEVCNLNIPGPGGALALRIYRPSGPGLHPVIVFFHGSGFVILDLDSHDDICRRLCAGASCVVVSVDYRLAPEHKFPAAPDDCLAATRWTASHAAEFGGDASRMAVAGDSAGACLAAVTAQRVRDEGEAFARRLSEGGVEAVTRRCASMNHGFLKYAGVIDEADAAMAHACAWLKNVLRQGTGPLDA